MAHNSEVTYHARERLNERYTINATKDDWSKALDDINNKRSILLARLENGNERHALTIAQQSVLIIYSPLHKRIITALPKNANVCLGERNNGNTTDKFWFKGRRSINKFAAQKGRPDVD